MDKNVLRLYAVTDRRWLEAEGLLWEAVEAALEGGATIVQLREKEMNRMAFREEAIEILDICRKFGVPLIIDDDVRLAVEIGADGVHLGQTDMACEVARQILGPDKIIGVTAKTPEQAIAAEKAGADYLGSGAVFATETKLGAKLMSLDTLKAITASVNIPVVAIGGITAENIRMLKGTGIAGVAVAGGIFSKDDVGEAAEELSALTEEIL